MGRPLRTVQPKPRAGFAYADYAAAAGGIVLDNGLTENDIIVAYPLTNEAATSIGREEFLHFHEESGHAPAILKVAV